MRLAKQRQHHAPSYLFQFISPASYRDVHKSAYANSSFIADGSIFNKKTKAMRMERSAANKWDPPASVGESVNHWKTRHLGWWAWTAVTANVRTKSCHYPVIWILGEEWRPCCNVLDPVASTVSDLVWQRQPEIVTNNWSARSKLHVRAIYRPSA